MRLLVLSDIHENITNIRNLRAQETNSFDVILVGGDVGNEIARDFYGIMDSFGCPVVVVYGNWDNELPYRRRLSSRCRLLHLQVENLIAGYTVAGYSGCPAHWGKNPIAMQEREDCDGRHDQVLREFSALRSAEGRARDLVEEDFIAREARLDAKYPDHRRVAYKEAHWKLCDQRTRALKRTALSRERFQESPGFNAYREDAGHTYARILERNRQGLFSAIADADVDPTKLIIMTHERLYRLGDHGITPLMHIFGHRHEYRYNRYKGTYYLNAAAVDNGLIGRLDPEPIGYCILTLIPGTSPIVERRQVPVPRRLF